MISDALALQPRLTRPFQTASLEIIEVRIFRAEKLGIVPAIRTGMLRT